MADKKIKQAPAEKPEDNEDTGEKLARLLEIVRKAKEKAIKSEVGEKPPAAEVKRRYVMKRTLYVRYGLENLSDEQELQNMCECILGVRQLVHDGLTYDAIIDKGNHCPCPKHSAAKSAAEMVKHGYVGEA